MERGEIKWTDRIVITRDEVSKKPKVEVKGLWTGRDRLMIGRMLLKAMRKSANEILKQHKQADLLAKESGEVKVVVPTKAEILAKARAAKKLKKEIREGNEDVRGQK